MRTFADTFLHRLRAAGGQVLAGLPGGGSNGDFVEAADGAGVRFVLTSTETGGALLAATLGELTGAPNACLATLGPGAASVTNGVAHAALDRCPLVALTDDLTAGDRQRFAHQAFDQSALLGSLAKRSYLVTGDAPDPSVIGAAIRLTTSGRPGPVHVATCRESAGALVAPEPAGSADGEPGAAEIATVTPPGPLATARRPVALVGLGVRAADAAAVARFCRDGNVPVLATYKGKGVLPDTDPLAAGVLTNARIESALLEKADVLIGIGLDPVELLPRTWTYAQPLVHVGRYPVPAAHLPFAAQLVGDIGAGLREIAAVLPPAEWTAGEIDELIRAPRARLWDGWAGFGPADVVRTCAEVLPDAHVAVDAGAHMFAATELWPATRPRQLLISNGLATMGFALPAAIAAAVNAPDAPVLALTGDGGLLIALAELRTAVRERARVIVVVFNDGSLSLIRSKLELSGRPPRGVDLGDMDWPKVAEGMGAAAFACTGRDELERALVTAATVAGPSLIDCRIDGSGYGRLLAQIR
ncbi:MAG TPA: thiamine pyrophosphate-binding protein [Actinophytocola sp.]|jgi:acetolactate synthase-1/2/3 large subunit|nr:thiamine pyrophosphate-binding protein [Actinophytocola sp.]